MSDYKQKTIAAIKSIITKIEQTKYQIKDMENDIKLRTDEINSIQVALLCLQEHKEASNELIGVIDRKKKIVKEIESRINYQNESLQKQKELLAYLKQHICPHEELEFDHHDPHKNETFNRCKLCGAVI